MKLHITATITTDFNTYSEVDVIIEAPTRYEGEQMFNRQYAGHVISNYSVTIL